MARSHGDRRVGGVGALILGLLMAAGGGGLAAIDTDQQPDRSAGADPNARSGLELPELEIADASNAATYVRNEFGSGWIDADRNCRNTRAEVLMVQSQDPVGFARSDECAVTSGLWLDPWSDQTDIDARRLDVDHTVPLANAWRSGAHAWTREQRVAYANSLDDPEHLIAIPLGENRQKGDRGPEEWKPPDEDSWCTYAFAWSRIKLEWDLSATQQEWDALEVMATTC